VIVMLGKKAGTKFTIIMRDNDPLHLQAAEILNHLGYHGKAQYVVDAILHYANRTDEPSMQDELQSARLDEKAIEAMLNRLLRERGDIGIGGNLATDEDQDECTVMSADEINLDDALDVLSGDGFSAIANALEMFHSM
jgi:hypothetical protein